MHAYFCADFYRGLSMLNTAEKTQTIKIQQIFCAIALVAFFGFSNIAIAQHEESKEKTFKPGEMIMHHISDAHQIHLGGSIYIPLPVIILNDGHLDVFMSNKFWDGTNDEDEIIFKPYTASSGATYENHHETIMVSGGHDANHATEHGTEMHAEDSHEESGSSVSEHGEMMASDTMHTEAMSTEAPMTVEEHHGTKALDFSITKSVFGMLLVLLIMILVFRSVAKSYEKRKGQAPTGMQNLLEPLILFVRNEVAIPSIGKKKADRYVPFLLTVFFFIWMCNLLGLIPFLGGFNITGTLSITIVLATLVFLITTFSGNKHYWGHIFWPPGVPLAIKFILVPIEIVSILMKPAVLMIRLTANIAAGHIIILAFVGLVLLFGQTSALAGYGVGVGAVLFMVFMFFIELLVAFLQAYVFTLLAAIYFGDATQEHHHDDHH